MLWCCLVDHGVASANWCAHFGSEKVYMYVRMIVSLTTRQSQVLPMSMTRSHLPMWDGNMNDRAKSVWKAKHSVWQYRYSKHVPTRIEQFLNCRSETVWAFGQMEVEFVYTVFFMICFEHKIRSYFKVDEAHNYDCILFRLCIQRSKQCINLYPCQFARS